MIVHHARARTLVATLAVAAVLAAPALAHAAAHPGKPAKATPLNDANIAAIVVAANDADVANGKAALKISSDAAVKGFAQMMVTDHTATNEKAKALAARLKLVPVQNATSRGIVKLQSVHEMVHGQ